ncbi:MAG: hypothetical protein U9R50_00195 [Campylobacterota bacterium]|nr:hypothetical protein [Campylobacterota bacterium]
MKTLYGVLFEEKNKNNKLELLEYVNDNNLGSLTFVTNTALHKSIATENLIEGSHFILQSLLLLGESLTDILKHLNILISNNITLSIINPNFQISSLTCKPIELTQSLLECEVVLHQKRLEKRRAENLRNGIKVGRKTGVLVRSKFDPHRQKIEELYQLGLSMKKIVLHIDVGTQQSLHHYIKSRGIKKS